MIQVVHGSSPQHPGHEPLPSGSQPQTHHMSSPQRHESPSGSGSRPQTPVRSSPQRHESPSGSGSQPQTPIRSNRIQHVQNPLSVRRSAIEKPKAKPKAKTAPIPIASCPVSDCQKVKFPSKTEFTKHLQEHVSIPKLLCCPFSIYGVTRLTPNKTAQPASITALSPHAKTIMSYGTLW